MRILRQRTFTLATELNLKAIKNAGLRDKLKISKAVKNSGTGIDKLGRELTKEQIALRQIRRGNLRLNNTFAKEHIGYRDPLHDKQAKKQLLKEIKEKKNKAVSLGVGIF